MNKQEVTSILRGPLVSVFLRCHTIAELEISVKSTQRGVSAFKCTIKSGFVGVLKQIRRMI